MPDRSRHFEGPERAVRFARRLHRRRHGGPPAFVGVVLLALGVLFLLDNLNLIEARNFIRTFWPTLLVVWGGARLVFGRGGERFIGGIVMGVGGILLGRRLFGWGSEIWGVFWPLLLIALGIHFLVHTRRGVFPPRLPEMPPPGTPPPGTPVPGASVIDAEAVDEEPDASVDESATLKQYAVMASVERKYISQALRGGQVTAVMGGIEIDLRDCRMALNEVRVDLFVVMGEVVFRIPRDWTVDSRISAVLANFEDKTDRPVETSSKRFVLHGSAIMGNVEVRN